MFRFVRSVVGESAWSISALVSEDGILRAFAGLAGADNSLGRGAGTGVSFVDCCDSRASRTRCSRASRKRLVVASSRMPAQGP
eukprot:1165357-Pleurochrysis_carterae.AAC.1